MQVEPADDGWGRVEEDASPRSVTRVHDDAARTVITRNDSPDVPFETSINPYRGCEHGCIYCFARPSHAYLGLSPGLDFETEIYAKRDAPELLRCALSKPGYRPRTLALGANTDPYQPAERDLCLTRSLLEVLYEFRHPVGIVTKAALVLRDVDLLAAMAEERLVQVSISVTTLDAELARRLEPRASTPARRLEAIRVLSERGVPVAVLASPMIPALNDWELERILDAAATAGAESASYIVLRLPREVADLFTEWLEEHYPQRARRVLSIMREMHDGKLYDSTWGTRMRGTGVFAELLEQRFRTACKRLGLDGRAFALDGTRFVVPQRAGQLGLFDRDAR